MSDMTKRIRIVPDECAENPRSTYDNASVLLAFHHRYSLSDVEAPKLDPGDYAGWDDMEAAIRRQEDAVALLPVYLYDHSGLSVSTAPFECQWDSGQLGFIYIPRKNLAQFGYKRVTERRRKQLLEYMESEIQELGTYLSQGCYGFIVEELVDGAWEHKDSCWGFVGYDHEANGMSDHLTGWMTEGYVITEDS